MKTIEERARLAAWQIVEEIGLSQHSVDRVSEIITEKMLDQKAIDIDKACEWIKENFEYYVDVEVSSYYMYGDKFVGDFRKAMEG